jgi:hypothetical protein
VDDGLLVLLEPDVEVVEVVPDEDGEEVVLPDVVLEDVGDEVVVLDVSLLVLVVVVLVVPLDEPDGMAVVPEEYVVPPDAVPAGGIGLGVSWTV